MINRAHKYGVLFTDEANFGATWEMIGYVYVRGLTKWVLENVAGDQIWLTSEQLKHDNHRMVCDHGYYFGDTTHVCEA